MSKINMRVVKSRHSQSGKLCQGQGSFAHSIAWFKTTFLLARTSRSSRWVEDAEAVAHFELACVTLTLGEEVAYVAKDFYIYCRNYSIYSTILVGSGVVWF
jgi:hypothetical protein